MDARTRPPGTRPMRFTLAALLIVPLVSLVALWAFGAVITFGNAARDRSYNASVGSNGPLLENLEGELTQERLQTFIWLSTDRRAPETALDGVRQRTDKYIRAYLIEVPGNPPQTAQLRRAQAALLRRLAGLPATRTAIDSGTVSPAAAFQAYSNIVDDMLGMYDSSGGLGLDSSVYSQDVASINSARALEYLGREAALVGGAAAARGQMSTADRALFATAVADQRLAISEALTEFAPQLVSPFRRLYSSAQYRQLAALEDQIAQGSAARPLPPATLQAWQATSTPFLGGLLKAQLANNKPLGQLASQAGNRLLAEAILASGLGLLAVIASVLLMVRFGRRLAGELSRLRRRVTVMADEQLPELVERLRNGEEADVAARAASLPDDQAGKSIKISEIATVDQAFDSVQRTAVEAAAGQARLRAGINRVFLNLSLRSQSLLHRQLAMLDTMERAARDPQALADLFQLDHLTTRMRRHAEGLIILSGETPGRGWREPVLAVDVLRAAVAEVEDYVRIDVVSESRDAVVGVAVNDVIHLAAELMENAAAFSPPTTQVIVRADAVGAGFAVEIEDRGLGMSAEEMTEINARLASPPEFDLADSEQLGLFVVGRLAARHGIRVSLRPSAYGGTTAVVLLPREIMVAEGDAGLAAVPGGALAGSRPVPPAAGPAAGPPAPERSVPQAPVFSLTGRHRFGWSTAPDGAPPGSAVSGDAPARGAEGRDAAAAAAVPAASPAAGPASRPAPDAWPQPAWRESAWPEPAAQPASPPAASPPPGSGGSPETGTQTHLGLPVRVRQASLAPQLRGGQDAGRPAPGVPSPGAGATPLTRTPEQARSLMAAMQRGWEHGRTDDLDDDVPGDLADWPGEGEGR